MSRQRGRIVLVGVTGLALNRSEFYEMELIDLMRFLAGVPIT